MKTLLILPLLAFTVLSQAASRCRCLYNDTCWPSEDQFSDLQSKLSQPLIRPVPPATPCYPPSDPSENCTDVLANASNGRWLSDRAGAMQSMNFQAFITDNGTIETCFLDTSLNAAACPGAPSICPTEGGSTETQGAAVVFAAEHDLRVVIKNTGHDLLGRSIARNSFMIWTHNLKNITYNPAFVPEGAPATETYDCR
ncbi:hypothetical protein K435DRAFT_663116 [Dendrothele bispora CBS 962.96]|uniref:FAD linked oxidase N-terminal domain-containing protein n=1 Tax=Dendrothele bispora (strain CBS 962.96) TaxID=1314807 RepID=A0A4S8M5B4_DENBC|nr:hypothetical protein K435DRAFT_663116 [Dendrothele bispora CBS 962.96]